MLLRKSLVVALLCSLSFGVGCSDDPDPIENNSSDQNSGENNNNQDPGDDKNACGGEDDLLFDGAPANPGDSCGECGGGALECDGDNALICNDDGGLNACGGCEVLEGIPGAECGESGVFGEWVCTVDGNVFCNEGELPDVVIVTPDEGTDIEATFEVGTNSAVFKASFEEIPVTAEIADHGFCWSLEPNPTLANSECESLGPVEEIGEFSVEVVSLLPGHQYYVSTYAQIGAIAGALTEGAVIYSDDIIVVTKAKSVESGTLIVGDAQAEFVSLSWDGIEGAQEYIVYRDGEEIGRSTSASFEDTTATAAPVPGIVENVQAQGYTNRVVLSWDEADVVDGPVHEYQVQAIYPVRESDLSDSVEGYRAAAPVEAYELSVNGSEFEAIGTDLTHEDFNAPANIIAGPVVSASQGVYASYVELSVESAASVSNTSVNYKLRAVNASGAGDASDEVSASRISGELEYQWEQALQNNESSFNVIDGAITASYEDTTAPANGAERYYRLVVSAQGAQTIYSDAVVGYRAASASVSTLAVSDVDTNAATLNGSLSTLGVPAASAHGFCYGISQNPALGSDATCVDLGAAQNIGEFSENVEGLSAGTEYFVRAFATTVAGTTYGASQNFWTITEQPVVSTSVRGNRITVNWNAVPGATEYIVKRDGEVFSTLTAPAQSYVDTQAAQAPAPGETTITNVSTDDTNGVLIEWEQASVASATQHTYEVIAINADNLESTPGQAFGQLRARPITGYQIKIGDGDWQAVGDASVLEYFDDTALLAEITPGPISVSQGTEYDHVAISASVQSVSTPATQTYQVRAVNASGFGLADEGEGQRGLGQDYIFTTSYSDIDADSPFDDLAADINLIGSFSYNDALANADGSDRFYQIKIERAGAETFESDVFVGYRAALPEVSTAAQTNVETTTVTFNGSIDVLGRPDIAEHGFCYGTAPNPDHQNSISCVTIGTASTTDTITADITGLSAGTEYYVRAYAISDSNIVNNAQTVYSPTTENFWTKTDAPTNVQATGIAHAVNLTWDAVTGAAKYEIWRQGPSDVEPVFMDNSVTNSYIDDNGIAGGAPEAVEFTATGLFDSVLLQWQVPDVIDGDTYDYYIIAINEDNLESAASTTESAAPQGSDIIGYDLEIDGGQWARIPAQDITDNSGTLSIEDIDANAPTLEAATITASLATVFGGVHLNETTPSPRGVDASTHTYRIRAVNLSANNTELEGDASEPDTAGRIFNVNATITGSWERKESTEDDTHYVAINPTGCNPTCVDETADNTILYDYRLVYSANNLDDAISNVAEGAAAQALLAYETNLTGTEFVAGQNFDVDVQFVNQFGDELPMAGIAIDLELTQGTFADGGTSAQISTDMTGLASFVNLNIEQAGSYEFEASSAYIIFDIQYLEPSDTFYIIPDIADATNSSITGESGKDADGQDAAAITIVLADQFDNPIVGVTPQFAATGSNNNYGACTPTNALGESTCSMTTTRSGDKILSITGPSEVVPGSIEGDSISFEFYCGGPSFNEGDGTEGDPYTVCNAEQLNNIGESCNDCHFVQMANITLPTDSNFNMIGGTTLETQFIGSYDGNGYTISNLTFDDDAKDYVGMFRYTNNASLKNIQLIDVDILGDFSVGSLIGQQSGGTIENSYATGTVSGTDYIGGLVGQQSGGTITNSFATCSSSAVGSIAGGLVGQQSGGTIENSYATGTVSAEFFAGGFVGYQTAGTITNSYATGMVIARMGAGGFASFQSNGTIENSYATGAVSGDEHVGGFMGIQIGGTIIDSYYRDGACSENCTGDANGTALNDTDLADPDSYEEFDFNDTWEFVCERPRLQWELVDPAVECPICDPLAADFTTGPGEGTEEDPFQICSGIQLAYLANDGQAEELWNKLAPVPKLHFMLVDDINMNGISTQPIGDAGTPFNGHFNGNGHSISNFAITSTANTGLFGMLGDGALVEQVGIESATIIGQDDTGILVGHIGIGATVQTSYTKGTATCTGMGCGGLVGANFGTIENVYSHAEVSGELDRGGLVGFNDSSITNAYAAGDVYVLNGFIGGGGLLVGNEGASSSVVNSFALDVSTCTNCDNTPENVISPVSLHHAEWINTTFGWSIYPYPAQDYIWKAAEFDFPKLWWEAGEPYESQP